jgi:hypothetical protein
LAINERCNWPYHRRAFLSVLLGKGVSARPERSDDSHDPQRRNI